MRIFLTFPQFENVTEPDGSPYKATTCWRDVYTLVEGARKFIYITGWSVFTEISLVRDGDGAEDEAAASNVGELLKRKAEEGVKVLVMVWNEKLSTDNSPGLMGTHDEDTRHYFEGTAVECRAVSRSKKEGILASEFVGTCYTHHQKTVIADAPVDEGDPGRLGGKSAAVVAATTVVLVAVVAAAATGAFAAVVVAAATGAFAAVVVAAAVTVAFAAVVAAATVAFASVVVAAAAVVFASVVAAAAAFAAAGVIIAAAVVAAFYQCC